MDNEQKQAWEIVKLYSGRFMGNREEHQIVANALNRISPIVEQYNMKPVKEAQSIK